MVPAMSRYAILLIPLLLAAAPVAEAAEKPGKGASGKEAGGNFYRYRNDKGVLVIDSYIPPEYARKGYQLVTRSGQVVQDVPPSEGPAIDEDAARKLREQEAQNSRRDVELRKLYSSPADAVRLRDRQLDAISLKIDFARGQVLQLAGKRKTDLEQAAALERQGKPVPKALAEGLERLNRQVAEQETQIRALEKDREELRAEFEPVIERLKVIYPNAPLLPPPPPPKPAATATPAAKPAPARP